MAYSGSDESRFFLVWRLLWAGVVLTGVAAVMLLPAPWHYSAALPFAATLIAALARPRPAVADQGDLVSLVDHNIARAAATGRSTGVMLLEIDNFHTLCAQSSRETCQQLQNLLLMRLGGALGQKDLVQREHDGAFAVALSPERRMDVESAIQLSSELQQAVAEPITIGRSNFYITASVGVCLARRLANPGGSAALQAARLALHEALAHGPAAIRCFTPALSTHAAEREDMQRDIARAIDDGEIRAFFQPQISTRTGAISGFEALARWQHPTRGLIPPGEFLPAVQAAGMMGRLGEKMMHDALDALLLWQSQGIKIGHIGVNFSTAELRDPALVERIGTQIDKRGLSPDRLVVEVLETVVASRSEDTVVTNLAGLSRLGCRIDLDDFGTGHASITNIRRFSVERIKIDRSFVSDIDTDAEKRSMVSAILTMAERLGLETLAEGVETAAEREVLTGLGCGHIQGFAIARPMPLEETGGWIAAYANPEDRIHRLDRRAV